MSSTFRQQRLKNPAAIHGDGVFQPRPSPSVTFSGSSSEQYHQPSHSASESVDRAERELLASPNSTASRRRLRKSRDMSDGKFRQSYIGGLDFFEKSAGTVLSDVEAAAFFNSFAERISLEAVKLDLTDLFFAFQASSATKVLTNKLSAFLSAPAPTIACVLSLDPRDPSPSKQDVVIVRDDVDIVLGLVKNRIKNGARPSSRLSIFAAAAVERSSISTGGLGSGAKTNLERAGEIFLQRESESAESNTVLSNGVAVVHGSPLAVARSFVNDDFYKSFSEHAASDAGGKAQGVHLPPAAIVHHFDDNNVVLVKYAQVSENVVLRTFHQLFVVPLEDDNSVVGVVWGDVNMSKLPIDAENHPLLHRFGPEFTVVNSRSEQGIVVISSIWGACSQVTLLTHTVLENSASLFRRTKIARDSLAILEYLQILFDRSDDIDERLEHICSSRITLLNKEGGAANYRSSSSSAEEWSLFRPVLKMGKDQAGDKVAEFQGLNWSRSREGNDELFEKFARKDSLGRFLAKGVGIVHADPDSILVHLMASHSTFRRDVAFKQGGRYLPNEVIFVSSNRSWRENCSIQSGSLVSCDVIFRNTVAWKEDLTGGTTKGQLSVLVVYVPRDAEPEEKKNMTHDSFKDPVEMKKMGFFQIDQIGFGVSKVTFVVQVREGGVDEHGVDSVGPKGGGTMPVTLTNQLLANAFEELQLRFGRSAKDVDADVRKYFVQKVMPVTLQKAITKMQHDKMTQCSDFIHRVFDESNVESSKPLQTSTPLLQFWKIRAASNIRSEIGCPHAMTKATGIVDVSVDECLAWMWDYGSHSFKHISKENEDRCSVVVSSDGREQVIANLVLFPWPLNTIEFVQRRMWTKEQNGTIILVSNTSKTVTCDYGGQLTHLKFSRLSMSTLCEFRPVFDATTGVILQGACSLSVYSVCKAEEHGNSVASVRVSDLLSNFLIHRNVIEYARETFMRDDDVDAAHRARAVSDLGTLQGEVKFTYENDKRDITKLQKAVKDLFILDPEATSLGPRKPRNSVGRRLSFSHALQSLASSMTGRDHENKANYKFLTLLWEGPPLVKLKTTEMRSPDPSVRMFSTDLLSEEGALHDRGKVFSASVVVHAPVEECAAWIFNPTSRDRIHHFHNEQGVFLEMKQLNESCRVSCSAFGFESSEKKGGVRLERFRCEKMYMKFVDEDTITLTSIPYSGKVEEMFPSLKNFSSNMHRDWTASEIICVKLESYRGLLPQTRVSYTFQIDTPSFSDRDAVKELSVLEKLKRVFDVDLLVDKIERNSIISDIATTNARTAYTAADNVFLVQGAKLREALMGEFFFKSAGFKPSLHVFSACVRRPAGILNGEVGQGLANTVWGCSTFFLRAPLKVCSAYFLDLDRRYKTVGLVTMTKRLEEKSAFNTVDYVSKKLDYEGSGRQVSVEFINRTVWQRVDRYSYVILSLPHSPDDVLERILPTDEVENGVRPSRGTHYVYIKLKAVNDDATKIEYVTSYGSSMSIKRQTALVKQDMTVARIGQEYFLKQRRLDDLDEADGDSLGTILVFNDRQGRLASSRLVRLRRMRTNRTVREANAETTIATYLSLKEFGQLYPWFPALICGMLDNWLHDPKTIRTKLGNLSSVEARHIGRSLSTALKARKTAAAGVDQWILNYPAISECCRRHPFFLSLSTAIAQRKLMYAPWGLMFRVTFVAFISMADVVTDIYAISMFWSTGRPGYAIANLAMVCTAMLMQMMLVFTQYRRRGSAIVFRESLIVLSNMKPAVDAYRICSGMAVHPDNMFEPLTEMTYSKCIDMFGENIPGGVLQLYAYAVSNKSEQGPLVSVAVSFLSTAYTSTILSLDLDTNPDSRKRYPSLYGYVPDDSSHRQMCFMFIFCICFSQVLMRSMFATLMLSVGPKYMGFYVLGDILLYLLVKVLRADLRYSLNVIGAVSWVASLFMRIGIKMVVDFTSIMHFRSPFEMGGIVWTMNIVASHGLCHFAGYLYSELYDGENKMPYSILMPGLIGLEVFSVLSFAGFVVYMNKTYLDTFYSTLTGPQFACWRFITSNNDEAMLEIFACHPSYYKSIFEEVVSWITLQQEKWELERPGWLDDRKLSMIPPSLRKTKDIMASRKATSLVRNVGRSTSFGGSHGISTEAELKGKFRPASLAPPKRLASMEAITNAATDVKSVGGGSFLRRLSAAVVPDPPVRLSTTREQSVAAPESDAPIVGQRRGSVLQQGLKLVFSNLLTVAQKSEKDNKVDADREIEESSGSEDDGEKDKVLAEAARRREESKTARQELRRQSAENVKRRSSLGFSVLRLEEEFNPSSSKERSAGGLSTRERRSVRDSSGPPVRTYSESGREPTSEGGNPFSLASGRERKAANASQSGLSGEDETKSRYRVSESSSESCAELS